MDMKNADQTKVATEGFPEIEGHLILFDGVCNLCNGFVQFVIKRDPQQKFVFAPLQSELASKVLAAQNYTVKDMNTVLLFKNGKLYGQSEVALEISKDLSGLWPAMNGFRIIPKFFRDWVYQKIADNRYNWFGKKDQCMIPTPELRARFLA